MTLRHLASPCGLLILAAMAQAQEGLPARVDAVFSKFTATTPGCGVGLGKDGRTLYVRGYGMANLEYNVPNTDSTVFESGSVAKQFTAAALVLLARDGKLSIDDDIRKYLPEVPDFGSTITIRNLLNHTSGLRDQWGLLGIEGRGPGTQVHSQATTLDLVVHQKMLNFPPGTEYLYSNTGYALAGIIVQRVSGKSLNDFMQERLFRPLGMTHTRLRDDFTQIVKNRATAYSGTEANGFHTDMPFTNMIGNGGVLSTMDDLMRWNEMLHNPTIFGGRGFTDSLETRGRLRNGRTIAYALGLEVSSYDGVREVGHSGSTAGYRTFLARYPDQHTSVAVWCNYAGANPTQLAHQVVDLVLTKPVAAQAAVPTAPTVTLSASDVAKYPGVYRDPHTDMTMRVEAAGTGLALRGPRGAAAPLTPLGNDRFRGPGAAELIADMQSGRRGLRMIRGDDTTRCEIAAPAPVALPASDYIGTYSSDELDARFIIEARDGKLVLKRRPNVEVTLTPAYADDFQAGPFGTIRFARDVKKRVTGFSIYDGRILDVRFHRN
jgi:CubicO group peptidase (beta-lactamase class C family)